MIASGPITTISITLRAIHLTSYLHSRSIAGNMADVSSMQQFDRLPLRPLAATTHCEDVQAPTGPWSTYARVLVGNKRLPSASANERDRHIGPGPQPLRGIPGFPTQQPQQNRNAPLGAGRLPNGKLGMRDEPKLRLWCSGKLISGFCRS